jgi:hypothetical protein
MSRRIVACVITAAVAALGLWLLLANVRSDQQIQQESAQRNAEQYVPMCDGKQMYPRDLCMRIGGNRKSQTYEEMVAEHAAQGTPEALSTDYARWRTAGLVVFGVGLATLALAGFSVLLVLRAGRGRRALAKAHDWGFEKVAHGLLDKLRNPELRYTLTRSAGAGVLFGTHNGFRFLVFDFLEVGSVNGKNTMFVLSLPEPLPRLEINAAGTSRLNRASSPGGARLFTDQTNSFVREHKLGWAAVNGTSLVYRWSGWFSPRRSVIEERLDKLTALAAMLLAAHRATPRADAVGQHL